MSLFQPFELDLDPGETDHIEATSQPGYWHVYPRASIGAGGVRLCNGPSIKAEGSHEIVGLMSIELPARDTKITLENRSSAAVHLFVTAVRGFRLSVERLEGGGGSGNGGAEEEDMKKLSASTDGQGIKVAATESPGTTIHTAAAGTSTLDEVWIYAVATGALDRKLTLQWGGVDTPDDDIEVTVTAEAGLLLIAPGLPLQNEKVVKAFAAAADEIIIHGHVITRTVD